MYSQSLCNSFIQRLRVFYSSIPTSFNVEFFDKFCKKSQREKVMWHLLEFGSITNRQCCDIYGIRHTPSVIRDLREILKRKNEYKIINQRKTGCDRFGNGCYWDEYKLVKVNNG